MTKSSILVSSARSGTNYFLSVYAQCFPGDFVAKEIFRPAGDSLPLLKDLLGLEQDEILALIQRNPLKLWQRIIQQCAAEQRRALAKIFYYHVPADNSLWQAFYTNNRIVHLIRRNALDVFVSREIAVNSGRWLQFGHQGPPDQIDPLVIDPSKVAEFLRQQNASIQRTRAFFAGADYTEIFYEDIAESADFCAAEICRLFGAPPPNASVAINLQKQKTRSNRELIANYADVAEFDKIPCLDGACQ